jgi:DNA sulfur modification protein DndB
MPSEPVQSRKPTTIPALRGTFGDWTYYSTVLPLGEIAERVSFADEIHRNKALSEWIQRSLKGGKTGGRAKDISDYLRKEGERFFNSLVIAVYGGTPEWFPIQVEPGKQGMPTPPSAEGILGALRLSGNEILFAVDGQHRLAGMKRLAQEGSQRKPVPALSDLVSALFIAHRTDKPERTRRLFTTLNKTAVPVSKMERIALDENDVMAIIARRLVETHPMFKSPRIAMHHTNNLGRDEAIALTTIGNLYDVLRQLFLAAKGAKKKELEFNRPSDEKLTDYYETAVAYFKTLATIEPSLAEYFKAPNPAKICRKYRHNSGGSIYFRPIGLVVMTEVAMHLKKKDVEWNRLLKLLPRNLNQPPFAGSIWSHRGTIEPKHRVLCRNLLLYMCGQPLVNAKTLAQQLSEVTGKATQLPKQIV